MLYLLSYASLASRLFYSTGIFDAFLGSRGTPRELLSIAPDHHFGDGMIAGGAFPLMENGPA